MEAVLDKQRAENATLTTANARLSSQVDELVRRVAYMTNDLHVLLDFIRDIEVELTDAAAEVIGKHEELRIIRKLQEGITGDPNLGHLYFRGLDD